ncbi:MAG: NADH-quinone oxidoreductase subunit L [Verrucomicrobiales bacterium]|nr:NADH-quinone oxidoreductase subunit L [Verrucomicrobiales bacterium]
MRPETLAWIILLLPLASAAAITLLTRRQRRLSAALSIGAVAVGFVASLLLTRSFGALAPRDGEFLLASVRWLEVGPLTVDLGLRLDALSNLMLMMVTGVGLMIHLYSRGYMADDASYSRFFACLSLFMFSMLGIVLASNFVMMFVFWELVGVSSYLLIGFWHERASAADAAKKAFLTNRLGDFGFLLGIILVWGALGTVDFAEIQRTLESDPTALGALATLGGVLVFMGTMGKSAQFPLHVWLPDAMEGPTPVSALIHAATMVAAGVYMLARAFFLFDLPAAWPDCLSFLAGISALDIIAWIGGITALLAALMAVQQSDIKRILAYSTLSQLGFMVMAIGCAKPDAGMFHLITHAFFKALLFLGAGSVIHALHHEQNIWKMGGLAARLPVTTWTFVVGTLALCGVPPFSGFYSKDGILAAAESRPLLFGLAILVAGLTTFYMARLYFVAFAGTPRDSHVAEAHESPGVMLWPLRWLAIASILGGFWGIEHTLQTVLAPAAGHGAAGHGAAGGFFATLLAPFGHAPLAACLGLFATGFGFALAYSLYASAPAQDPLPARLGSLARWMRDKFYFDELYDVLVRVTHDAAAAVADWVDRWLVAGLLVRGTLGGVDVCGRILRLVQTGNLQTYAFLAAAGLVLVLWVMLL